MPHMHLVTRPNGFDGEIRFWRVWVLVVLLQSLIVLSVQAQQVLDLSVPRHPNTPGGGEVSVSTADNQGESHSTKKRTNPSLPLEVTLLSVSPETALPATELRVEMMIRNIGTEAILIPASQSADIIRSGNRDQQILRISVRLTHKGRNKTVDVGVGRAAGAANVASSMITLVPGGTLLLIGSGLSSATFPWREAGYEPEKVEVKAAVEISFLDDNSSVTPTKTVLHIKATSETAVSKNASEITWKGDR
jgi:hypothetical protein